MAAARPTTQGLVPLSPRSPRRGRMGRRSGRSVTNSRRGRFAAGVCGGTVVSRRARIASGAAAGAGGRRARACCPSCGRERMTVHEIIITCKRLPSPTPTPCALTPHMRRRKTTTTRWKASSSSCRASTTHSACAPGYPYLSSPTPTGAYPRSHRSLLNTRRAGSPTTKTAPERGLRKARDTAEGAGSRVLVVSRKGAGDDGDGGVEAHYDRSRL